MNFNPVQSYNQGFALAQEQQKLKQEAENQAIDARKRANFQDARNGRNLLENKNYQGFLDFTANRIEAIEATGGDSSHTRQLLNLFNIGQVDTLVDALKGAEEQGVTTTDSKGNPFLPDLLDRQYKQAKINELTNNKGVNKPKLGTYNPSDYTIKTWSEFAKNGDPSILERYGKGPKERQMELREEAQLIKEEKFQLSKQKAESDKAKSDILSSQKKRDTARAKFLQIKEAENAISNINSLLSNDLDLIYGGAEWVLPDKLRSQKGKNMMARRDQVASTMSLMAADKLKGQGTITDPERAMLAEVASMLKNQDISAERAKAELERVKPIFEYFMTGDNKTKDGNSVNWSDL